MSKQDAADIAATGTQRQGAERNLELDILRVVFAVCVVMRHTFMIQTPNGEVVMHGGYRAVEFFFMVSGFLMAESIERKRAVPAGNQLGKETTSYLLGKIKRIFPYNLIYFILIYSVSQYAAGATMHEFIKRLFYSWHEVSFLYASGVMPGLYNGFAWYLSAMFIAILVIYPLQRAFPDVFRRIAAPLVCIFVYGYFSKTYFSIARSTHWQGFICEGLLRAFAGISCGSICFEAVQFLKGLKWKTTALNKTAFVTLKAGILLVILVLMHRTPKDDLCGEQDFTSVLLIAILVTLVCAGGCQWGNAHQGLSAVLAEYSLSLFLCHRFWVYFVNCFCAGSSAFNMFTVYFWGSFLSAAAGMLAVPRIAGCFIRLFRNALLE